MNGLIRNESFEQDFNFSRFCAGVSRLWPTKVGQKTSSELLLQQLPTLHGPVHGQVAQHGGAPHGDLLGDPRHRHHLQGQGLQELLDPTSQHPLSESRGWSWKRSSRTKLLEWSR